MDATKAGYFLQDLAAYRAGEIDETAMIENLMYFLNTNADSLTISQEEFDALMANYASLDEMLAYYEKVAKDLVNGTDTASAVSTPSA